MTQELKDKVMRETDFYPDDNIANLSPTTVHLIKNTFVQGAEFMYSLIGGGWIDVNKNRPEYYKLVQVWGGWNKGSSGGVYTAWLAVDDDGNDIYTLWNNNTILSYVTFWQPLPLPPNENKND